MSYAMSKIDAAIVECEKELAFLGGHPTAPRDTTYDSNSAHNVVPDLIVEVGENNCKYIQPENLNSYADEDNNPIEMGNLEWKLAAVYGLTRTPYTYVLVHTAVFPESGVIWKEKNTENKLKVRYAMRSILAYKQLEFEDLWRYRPSAQMPLRTANERVAALTHNRLAALEGVLVLFPGVERTQHRPNDSKASFQTFSPESVYNPTALSELEPWRINPEEPQGERKRARSPSDSEEDCD
jgi:hypothetical protein